MHRRQLLGLLGASALSVAGCLGPDMPADAVVRAVPEAQPGTGSPVRYGTLPEPEQRIVRTAVGEEYFHACPELPESVRSFAGRFEDHESAVLSYRGSTYALWIRVADIIHASTAPPPESEPSCGLL